MRRRWTSEAGMFGASLLAAFSVARLATGVAAAVLVTAAIGTLVVAALRRRGAMAVATAVFAVGVSALWWGLRSSTRFGVPSLAALRTLRHSLQLARTVLIGFHLPLVHMPGIVFLGSLFGGLVAIAGRAMGIRYPALSLLPAAVLLVWSAILLPTTSAALGGLALGACGLLVLMTEQSELARASVAVAAISLGSAALTLGWATVSGSGVVSPGGQAVPAVAPSALSLTTDLTGVEIRDANVVLFRTTSPVSTYWQVAALTTFVSDQWVPDPATAAVLRGSTTGQASAPPVIKHVFTARVTLSAYRGRLLPAPPSTIAAAGATDPVVTPVGVVATAPLISGGSYSTTAVAPSAVADSPAGSTSPPTDTELGPIPAVVRSTALSITGGQSTPLDKAEALTDFFRSGHFHYKIDARPLAGSDPLVAFLTQTRTGSCQQFAGAFAVLARASGLSARVAIGFTPGRPSDGISVVRGSDAHAWPQVLISGSWVSFEPTPQLPSGELSPPGVLGPSGLGQPNPTGQGSQPPVSVPVVPTPTPTFPPLAAPAPLAVHPVGSGVLWGITFLLLAAIAAVVLVLWRRRRRAPIDRVVAGWQAIDRALERRSMARPRWCTPMGHVRSLSDRQQDEQASSALGDMATVATALQDVTYGSVELPPDAVERAVRASRRARRAILAGALSGSREPGFGSPEAGQRSDVAANPGRW